jgi:hypothetical protein
MLNGNVPKHQLQLRCSPDCGTSNVSLISVSTGGGLGVEMNNPLRFPPDKLMMRFQFGQESTA